MPFCQNCGHKVANEAKFCPDCGKAITQEDKSNSVYKYVIQSHGRVHVHQVMAQCKLSREEAIPILQKLRSKGYIGGNAKDGYWFTSKEMPKEIKKISEKETADNVLKYLKEHRETNFPQIAKDLHLTIPTIKETIKKLERCGKIQLKK